MAYFDKYGVEFSDDRKTLIKCPKNFYGDYIIPDYVIKIGRLAFWSCSGLMNVAIPNSVISIGNGAFHGAGNIMYSGAATGAPWDAKSMNGDLEKAKEERRKLAEKRKLEIKQTKKENRRIIIVIIIAILGAMMLFNAKCSKTKSHHHEFFDPSMEYRHT